MLSAYIPLLIFAAVIRGLGATLPAGSFNLGPQKPHRSKLRTYESGIIPEQPARQRLSVRFYLTAMLFVVFDIEVIFLYPWAVVSKNIGLMGLVAMVGFIAVLLVGYLYAWQKGALEWD